MNQDLSNKYIEELKKCTDETEHEDADILVCEFLEEIGYSELAEHTEWFQSWFS